MGRKRGTSPSAGECLRNQERRKSCRGNSTGQKTSNKRLYRFFSPDSGTPDTDHGAQKNRPHLRTIKLCTVHQIGPLLET